MARPASECPSVADRRQLDRGFYGVMELVLGQFLPNISQER